jgi:hypothetical protein
MLTERFPRPRSGTPAAEPRTSDYVKKPIRLAWALTAGLASAGACWGAFDANPGAPSAPSTPSAASPADNRSTIAVPVAKAHEWELQLELALLGDPLTFPYPLHAHITAAGMEIRGRVPNVWIRDHAMKLAKNACEVAVVDGMTVEPKMAIPMPHMQTALFATEARQRLERAGVKVTGPVEILGPGNGQIVLSGKIGSLEDKVQMSRALRGLPGCTCVTNELVVAGAVQPAVHVAEPVAAKEPARVKRVEHTVPAEAPAVAHKMPETPVAPMKGTLRKESKLAAGLPAKISFDDEKEASHIVPTAGQPDKPAKKETPAKLAVTIPKGPPSAETQAVIQKKLKSTVNRSAREIVMQFDDNGGAKIRVKIAKISDVEKVHAAIQKVPELAPYDLNIEFVIDK